jgi:hypothetical protein
MAAEQKRSLCLDGECEFLAAIPRNNGVDVDKQAEE